MKTPVARVVAALIAVVALVLAGLTMPASAATSTAKLKGTVTLDGKPVSFAKVQLFRLVYDSTTEEFEVSSRLKTDNTDRSGRYDFSGLSATSTSKRYVVLVTDRSSRGVTTYRSVVVTKGRTLTKNVHLKAGATVTGKVTTSDGRSPEGLTVNLDSNRDDLLPQSYDKLNPVFDTTVRADGTFTLAGVPATGYDAVQVMDGRHATQCYDLVDNTLTACDPAQYQRQRISLAAGQTRALPTVTKTTFAPPVTKVSGKVTDTSGKPLKGIEVSVLGDSVRETVVTRSSGRYSIEQSIPAGQYTLRFDDPKYVWAAQYLGGGPDKSVRQQVTVTPGQPVSGLDTALKSIANAKIATKGGKGTAKVAFRITRKASGSAPGGRLTLSLDGVSKTVTVIKGAATVILTGLPKGYQSLTAFYSGTGSTAEFSKPVKVMVK